MGDLSGSIERPGMERTIDYVTFIRSMAGQSMGRSQGGEYRRASARGADFLHPKRLISEHCELRKISPSEEQRDLGNLEDLR